LRSLLIAISTSGPLQPKPHHLKTHQTKISPKKKKKKDTKKETKEKGKAMPRFHPLSFLFEFWLIERPEKCSRKTIRSLN